MIKKETEQDIYNKLRQEAWNQALFCFGYSYIYNERSIKTSKILNFLTFMGIITPIIIGSVVMTYGLNSKIAKNILLYTSPIPIIQLVLSVWSTVSNLNGACNYYYESSLNNSELAEKYEQIGKFPPNTFDELKSKLEKIDNIRNFRENQDAKYPLTDKEKRKAMRYSLRKYKRSCAGCNQIPIDMKSTDCGICGNF